MLGRALIGCLLALAVMAALLPGSVRDASAAEGDVGYMGATYSGAGTDPTGSKPESKLWVHDAYWWGSLWDPVSKDFHISRLDTGTQQWTDTGVTIDGRAGTRSDALAEGNRLYIASHAFSNTASAGSPSYLYRYTYDTALDRYSLDAGFPVLINNQKTETLVIDKAADGTLWATWPQGTTVYVNHTVGGNDKTWGTPYALPAAGASGISDDDISSLIAFQDKVGVMWGNQTTETMHFATHRNGDPDATWSSEVALAGPRLADDHISLKADSSGRVFAATKTGRLPSDPATDPYAMLLVRDATTGSWASHVVAIQEDRWTRPIVLLEEGNNTVHVFATSGEAGGTIYHKTSAMDTISFQPGKGTPYVRNAANLTMNNATSTKQNVTDSTDLVVLAANAGTSTYWHNFTTIGPADTTPPTNPAGLSATAASFDHVDLSWTAATDDTGVVGYDVWRNGALVASIGPATTFADTSVAGGTAYTYEVRARDHVGNVSGPSNSASVTTPAVPEILRFQPEADARVEEANAGLNFGADGALRTDGGSDPDIESYLRFTVSGMTGTIRSVKLRAFASSGTLDGPAVFTSSSSWSEPGITWSSRPPRSGSGTDDKGVLTASTWVEWNVTPLVTGNGTFTLVLAGTTSDGVNVHSRENLNKPELIVTFDHGPPDTTPPTDPTGLSATASSYDRVDLAWNASTDNVAISGYEIYRDGSLLTTTSGTGTTFADSAVSGGTTYAYLVRARDPAGNVSGPSNSAGATTPATPSLRQFAPDADARVEEANASVNYGSATELKTDGGASADRESYLRFTVTGVFGSIRSVKLRLFASTQTVDGPAVYRSSNSWAESAITWASRPAREGAAADDKGTIAVGTWTEWDVTSLVQDNGTYTFLLATSSSDGVAFHSREGANKPELVVTYDAAPDTTPPTNPSGLSATAASFNRVDLTWTASSDNVEVTGYEIWRNGSLHTTTSGAGTTYADTPVAAESTYSYEVRARDAAGNVSGPSNSANATTPSATITLRFAPTADARVVEANAAVNFGTATELRTDAGSGPDEESYLTFSVAGVTGAIQSVKLRLYAVTSGTNDGPAVFSSSSDWTETAITWDNRPARSGSGVDDKGAIPVNAWAEWDVTSLVTGNGTFTLVLAQTGSDGVNFQSREGANRPELVVVTSS